MDIASIAIALMVGIGIGYVLANMAARKKPEEKPVALPVSPDWSTIRKTLTGTQLEILQHMEAKKQVSINGLYDKFSAIPDRELYYRLEQIVLMEFLVRRRKEGEVYYLLSPGYAGTIEDDKTVMLIPD